MNRRKFVGGSLAAIGFGGLLPITGISVPIAESQPVQDRLEIQVGPALVRPLFSRWKDDGTSRIPLIASIGALRQQLCDELVLLPLVRIRDNQRLEPNAWQIIVDGEVVAEGSIVATQKWNPLNHLPILGRLAAVAREHQDLFLPPDEA